VSESQPKTVEQMVAEAEARIESLSPEQVAAEIGGTNVTLVDVREDDERFLEGAIPGSVHVPRGCWSSRLTPTAPSTGRSWIATTGSSSIARRGLARR
jgi:Rhodanese-like domain